MTPSDISISNAIFNFNRLHEEPIPEISEKDNSISENDSTLDSTDDTDGLENVNSHSQVQTFGEIDMNSTVHDVNNTNEQNEMENANLSAENPLATVEEVLTNVDNNELEQNEMENVNSSPQDPLALVESEEFSAQRDVENNESQQVGSGVSSDQNPLSTENNSSTDVKRDVYPTRKSSKQAE